MLKDKNKIKKTLNPPIPPLNPPIPPLLKGDLRRDKPSRFVVEKIFAILKIEYDYTQK
jgi:hypothetical protein